MKKRTEEVDILRGIAAALMILGHSFIVYPVDISQISWCHAIGHFIYTFHMELFFVLAGVVYHCSGYRSYMLKKTRRILVPYLFFGALTLLLKAFGGSTINGVEPVREGVVRFLFRGGNYWFLYTLFLIFAVYPLIDRIHARFRWFAPLLAAALLVLRQFAVLDNWLQLDNIVRHLPYFIFGRMFGGKVLGGPEALRLTPRMRICLLALSAALFAALDLAEIRGGTELGTILSFVRAICVIVFLYLAVNGILRRSAPQPGLLRKLLADCSRFSLQLYLFNGFLLTILRILICNVLHITSPLVIVLGIWVGNLAITIVACRLIIPRIPVLRDLCGMPKTQAAV